MPQRARSDHLRLAVLAAAARGIPAPKRWDHTDGDFVDVDFVDGPDGAPWVQLFHGL